MEKINLNDYLASNEYPGRGIAVAMAPMAVRCSSATSSWAAARTAATACLTPCRARRHLHHGCRPDKLEDPSLIIYNPVLTLARPIS